MMNEWFLCTCKYEKTTVNGTQKQVSEKYLFDAINFAEAEQRVTEEMTPYIIGEFQVTAVQRMKISELMIDPNGDRWYKAKVNFITLDEKTGIEKKSPSTMLIQASDFEGALKNLKDGMKGTMSDWEIASLQDTPILDVFGMQVATSSKEDDNTEEAAEDEDTDD